MEAEPDIAAIVAGWREGLARLDPDRPPAPGIIDRSPGPHGRSGVWRAVLERMIAFVDERGEEAARLGWTATRLFGVHRTAGAVRADSTGALVSLYPRRVVAMSATEMVLRRSGVDLICRKMTNPGESIPVWEFKREGTRP